MGPGTLARRIAGAASAAAIASAIVGSAATAIVGSWLIVNREDERIGDAAQVLADELEGSPDDAIAAEILEDERTETRHTDLVFAVRRHAHLVAGSLIGPAQGCADTGDGMRACVRRAGDLEVVAAAPSHFAARSGLLALAGLSATIFAMIIGVVASRRAARWAARPFANLEARIRAADLARGATIDLGSASGVMEADAIKSALDGLVSRLAAALQTAEGFAAGAAHELRTPLAKVRVEIELALERDDLPPSLRSDLSRARDRLVELATLIDHLLLLAVPAESSPLSQVVSLRERIEHAQANWSSAAALRMDQGDEGLVRGDIPLLDVLLKNALENAERFAKAEVVARIRRQGKRIFLEIDDDGPGVADVDRARLFEPFVRGPGTAPGHGIGLALVSYVARAHGGHAGFVDGAKGARLQVELPALDAA